MLMDMRLKMFFSHKSNHRPDVSTPGLYLLHASTVLIKNRRNGFSAAVAIMIMLFLSACSSQEQLDKTKKNRTANDRPGKNSAFRPGQVWVDEKYNPVNAHGGGILY